MPFHTQNPELLQLPSISKEDSRELHSHVNLALGAFCTISGFRYLKPYNDSVIVTEDFYNITRCSAVNAYLFGWHCSEQRASPTASFLRVKVVMWKICNIKTDIIVKRYQTAIIKKTWALIRHVKLVFHKCI